MGKSGNPCERFMASCSFAIKDILLKMLVVTWGSLDITYKNKKREAKPPFSIIDATI